MSDENQWYTNKELFERLSGLRDEFNGLRSEMQETRLLIRNYNGLREELHSMHDDNEELRVQVQTILNTSIAKRTTFNDLRSWGGWVFGLITLIILVYNQIT